MVQLYAVKEVHTGAEVEQSAGKRTVKERVFVIPEVINGFVDEFRWDTRLYCVSACFWILSGASRTKLGFVAVAWSKSLMLGKSGLAGDTSNLYSCD